MLVVWLIDRGAMTVLRRDLRALEAFLQENRT